MIDELLVNPVARSRQLEVVCTNANQGSFNLPLDNQLQQAVLITSIIASKASEVSNGPTSGAALQPDNVFAGSFLTIITQENNVQQLSQIPLNQLNLTANYGQRIRLDLPPINVNACYISWNGTAPTVGDIWLLTFNYWFADDLKRLAIGNFNKRGELITNINQL